MVDVKVAKSSYAITTTVGYNLLLRFQTTANPTDYIHLAGSAVTEYTGGASWAGVAASLCDSVITGWTASGAGYAASNGVTGPWRSWAGGN